MKSWKSHKCYLAFLNQLSLKPSSDELRRAQILAPRREEIPLDDTCEWVRGEWDVITFIKHQLNCISRVGISWTLRHVKGWDSRRAGKQAEHQTTLERSSLSVFVIKKDNKYVIMKVLPSSLSRSLLDMYVKGWMWLWYQTQESESPSQSHCFSASLKTKLFPSN